jgi:glutaredoxin/uncharacterized damage-inducible protein DinB
MNTLNLDAGTPSAGISPAKAAGLRLFWQPGCSSCVKVKEMLTELGVPFTSVNILEHDDAMDEMIAHGARAVPVLIRDKEMIFAQSLEDVAKFVGRERPANRLAPEELMKRWQYFLDTGLSLVAQIPPDRINEHPVIGRERTVCSLAYHIYQIAEGFLSVVNEVSEDSRLIDNADYPHLKTKEQIADYARTTIGQLQEWWSDRADRTGARKFKTYYGLQPLHQILDRATWHTAQHTRQLNTVLDGFGLAVQNPIDPAAYIGLPMPKAVWE